MKVLIISHNPITTYQNMGKTFLSLFSSFDKTELCHLYIYPTLPDIDICNSYFRVTDRDILKSYFQFGQVKSRVIREQDIDKDNHSLYESTEDAIFIKEFKKNSLTLLCRDIMWMCSRWYNKELKKWLENENPTCIFLAPGESKFIYNIALKIAKKLNIDLFTYLCDEFYFVHRPSKFIDRIHLLLLQKKMKSVVSKSKGIITICEELANIYHDEFGVETYVIFTGSNYPVAAEPFVRSKISGITFMGNLAFNRFESIAEIGNVLDELNMENGTEYKLFLYTTPLKEKVQKLFLNIQSIQYMGYVTGKEFENILYNTDILLHVEAFDSKSIDRVKHSISTKIADSLASGALFFAYGPKEIASMQHLIRNQCAVVVTEHLELKKMLYNTLYECDRGEIIKKSLTVAKLYHSSTNNSNMLRNIVSDNYF